MQLGHEIADGPEVDLRPAQLALDEGGHGGGPSLQELASIGAANQMVIEGRNEMPGFGATLTPEQIRDVTAYVFAEFNE